MNAVLYPTTGGPEVITFGTAPKPAPNANQVLVKNMFVGVNFIDTYHRSGLYKVPLPYIPGREASGIVEAVGEGVQKFKVGDRVAYMAANCCAEYAVAPEDFTIKLPEALSFEQGAALLLQGATVMSLTKMAYEVKKGDYVLIHAAAGGTGLLLTQVCKHVGAYVIGTTSTPEKAKVAKEAGCDEVILYTSQDIVTEVKRITNNQGVHVVYDGVGKTTFDASLASLRRLGTMASFGNASGKVQDVDIMKLVPRAVRLMRPSLFELMKDQKDFDFLVTPLLEMVAKNQLKLHIHKVYNLKDTASAQKDLEGRTTLGRDLHMEGVAVMSCHEVLDITKVNLRDVDFDQSATASTQVHRGTATYASQPAFLGPRIPKKKSRRPSVLGLHWTMKDTDLPRGPGTSQGVFSDIMDDAYEPTITPHRLRGAGRGRNSDVKASIDLGQRPLPNATANDLRSWLAKGGERIRALRFPRFPSMSVRHGKDGVGRTPLAMESNGQEAGMRRSASIDTVRVNAVPALSYSLTSYEKNTRFVEGDEEQQEEPMGRRGRRLSKICGCGKENVCRSLVESLKETIGSSKEAKESVELSLHLSKLTAEDWEILSTSLQGHIKTLAQYRWSAEEDKRHADAMISMAFRAFPEVPWVTLPENGGDVGAGEEFRRELDVSSVKGQHGKAFWVDALSNHPPKNLNLSNGKMSSNGIQTRNGGTSASVGGDGPPPLPGFTRLKVKPIKPKEPEDDEILNVMDDDDGQEGFRGKSGKGYLWEEEYKRSWDVLQEDEDGSLQGVVNSIVLQKRRRLQARDTRPVQRGIIRHVCMVLDLSRAMADTASADHLRPSKLECTLSAAETFVAEFFDVNPLGSLGIVAMRDGIVERITDMSGNPSEHIAALQKKVNREVSGEPSLQNALEMSKGILLHVPSHGTREILILYGSLTTCDPGDIFTTIEQLKKDNIRVSIIGLTAEMKICKTICKETNGSYTVVLSETHLKETISQNVPPPPMESKKAVTMMIEMGFPLVTHFDFPTLCVCPKTTRCTGCKSIFPPLPTTSFSRRMSTTEPASTRSTAPTAQGKDTTKLPAPLTNEIPTGRFECERCGNHFCIECDLFAHEILHNCVGCASHSATAMPLMPSSAQKGGSGEDPMAVDEG
ncbi:hypothetical protein HDU67_002032 [Dinochytrium kinnereticum]|nr:hypothetical protein HDU67_002032 [Dinochytrium kinnereticum]